MTTEEARVGLGIQNNVGVSRVRRGFDVSEKLGAERSSMVKEEVQRVDGILYNVINARRPLSGD